MYPSLHVPSPRSFHPLSPGLPSPLDGGRRQWAGVMSERQWPTAGGHRSRLTAPAPRVSPLWVHPARVQPTLPRLPSQHPPTSQSQKQGDRNAIPRHRVPPIILFPFLIPSPSPTHAASINSVTGDLPRTSLADIIEPWESRLLIDPCPAPSPVDCSPATC